MNIRTQFPDMYLVDALPALDEVIMSRYDKWPPQYTQVFRVKSSNRSIEQTTQVAGPGTFLTVPENGPVAYDEFKAGFPKTYQHIQKALGMRGSKLLIDDDKWGIFSDMAGWLGRSAAETRELEASSVYNLAFDAVNSPGPDGKALCATDHPLYKVGGVQANTPTIAEDLDIDSLQRGLTAFRKLRSASGIKMRLRPQRLVVAPENEWNAAEILSGKMRADTANNTESAFKNRSGMPSFSDWTVYEYLTDPDAWFILAEQSEMEVRFYDREKPSPAHDVDFDTRSIKTAMWMRYSYGFSDYIGVYGSPGA